MILRYDGSLAGFLCLAGRAVKERLEVTAVISNDKAVSGDLFSAELTIGTDRDWAATVARGLESRLGKRFLATLGQALFSEEDQIEADLIRLVRRALTEGRQIMQQLAHPLIHRVNSSALRTDRERHRLLGLLRFCQLADDSYLGRVEPRCNVVPLLGKHFAKRLGDQRWLIIDLKRGLGVWGENGSYELVENIQMPSALPLHPNEVNVAELWRGFYHNISNPARYNPKLRQQLMPKRYWAYLTELQ